MVALGHNDIEVADPSSVRAALSLARPHVVVNTAALVRVDECEDRPEEAFRVNAVGALHVALACASAGALCVYVSTDYVFNGGKGEPYSEDDVPSPVNVYGASKLAGEHLVCQASSRWLIARVSSLFGVAGSSGRDGNFVETVIRRARAGSSLRVVSDVRMSPTYANDAPRALERLLREDATGFST